MKQTPQLSTRVVPVGTILRREHLQIPVYQRPYKWTTKHVQQLIKDIRTFQHLSAYRLGTVVLHHDQEENSFNIVDGQQRLVSLSLIAHAIVKNSSAVVTNPKLKDLLDHLKKDLFNPIFRHDESLQNLNANYTFIDREVRQFDEKLIEFFFFNCEVIEFVLSTVAEAFQFFDAQNARGKELAPHDLLKAFHLREFSPKDESIKTSTVDVWEKMKFEDLSHLFGNFLFRVRSWARLQTGRYFTPNETDLFKGVNVERGQSYLHAAPLRITHFFVDDYNRNFERQVDGSSMPYPFQLDQTIINGRRFFEMVSYYKLAYDEFKAAISNISALNNISKNILDTLDTYESRTRTGDTYVRMLFDCALMFYKDRFGLADINKAIEKIFIWAYWVRLKYKNVQLAAVDNYVLQEMNVFLLMKEAVMPEQFLSFEIPLKGEVKATKVQELQQLFSDLKYHHDDQ